VVVAGNVSGGRDDPPAGRSPTAGLTRRALWSFTAQILSSSGNFLLTALVLTVATPAEFAVFSICLTGYQFLLVLFRALVSVPVALLYSGARADGDRTGAEESAAMSLGMIAACLTAAAIAAASLLVDVDRDQVLVLAVGLPFVLWQDGGRYVAFARARPSVAASSDGLWLGLQVAGCLAVFGLGRASPASLFATWALAGAVAGGVAGIRLQLSVRLSEALLWIRTNWGLCRRLLLENTITSGGVYALFYGLVFVSDAGQLGHLKAAQTLLGPVSVLLLGGAALGVPESVRSRDDGPRLSRFAVRLSVFLAGFTVACGTAVYFTLPLFGPRLFPNAWAAARPLVPLLVVFNGALGVSTGAVSGIRALGGTAWIVRARSASTLVLLVIGLPAATVVGANGALFGLAVAEMLLAVAAWRHFARLGPGADTRPEAEGAAPATTGDGTDPRG